MNDQISPIGEKSPMTAEEARVCVEEIRKYLGDARPLILELYERQGWEALGYGSWRECVMAEFGFSQPHLYRQLTAARIESEISPIGEIGEIPESQLRPLAKLDPKEQAEAWQEAVATAPNGKVTAKHVQQVVNRRLGNGKANGSLRSTQHEEPPESESPSTRHRPCARCGARKVEAGKALCPDCLARAQQGKSRINGVLVDDPPDIRAQREAGSMDPEVIPNINEPIEDTSDDPRTEPDPPEPSEEDLSDEEWIAALPLHSRLQGPCRKSFDANALNLYRALETTRDQFARSARRALSAARRKGGSAGPLFRRISFYLAAGHPKNWKPCPPVENGGCGGTGMVELIGECPRCKGQGYWIP